MYVVKLPGIKHFGMGMCHQGKLINDGLCDVAGHEAELMMIMINTFNIYLINYSVMFYFTCSVMFIALTQS